MMLEKEEDEKEEEDMLANQHNNYGTHKSMAYLCALAYSKACFMDMLQ